jgi:hypothetical protein
MKFKHLKKFYNLPKTERKIVLEAYRNLLWTKLLVQLYSYRKLEKKFQISQNALRENITEVEQIKEAILKVSNGVKAKNLCLLQTFTARKMLNKRKLASSAYLAIKHDENGHLEAHAWIKASGIQVIPQIEGYTDVHEF